MTCDSIIVAQVLYADQSIVKLIGDVNCPNRKRGGEKCVYLRSFEESKRAPTNVSIAKLAVACSIFLLRMRNRVLLYLVGPTSLKKGKVGLPESETLASNVTVHPPIKTLRDKSRGS